MTHDTIPPESHELTVRYEFIRELGRGGMATVYLARERESGREVAIKLVDSRHTDDSEVVRRFAREARTVAVLKHPNIVETLAIEEFGGTALAIVNEFVHGQTLRDALASSGPFTYERTIQVLCDVSSALAHAHELRIVHRDVKPANIIIEAASGRALLTDFGIARALDSYTLLTVADVAVGTPTYMAPEQISGRAVDERSDVYALGLLGWEMLTGKRPWQGETLYSVLHKQQHSHLPQLAQLRPDIPVFLMTAINVAIAKDPDQRWRNAAEFRDRLNPTPVAEPVDEILQVAETNGAANETVRVTRPRTGFDTVSGSDPAAVPRGESGAPSRPPSRLAWLELPPAPDVPRDKSPLPTPAVASAVALTQPGTPDDTPPEPTARKQQWIIPLVVFVGLVLAMLRFGPSRARPHTAAAVDHELDSLLLLAFVGGNGTLNVQCRSAAATDQAACLAAAAARIDSPVNRVYDTLVATIRRQSGVQEPLELRALRLEQRVWTATRDSVCRTRGDSASGSLWGIARAPCYAKLAAQRGAELKARMGR